MVARSNEPDDTRGLSQRELILILLDEVKVLQAADARRPTRSEIYTTIGTVSLLLVLGQVFL